MKKSVRRYFSNGMVVAGFVFSALTPAAYALDFSFMGALTVTNYNLSPVPPTTTVGTSFGVGATVGMDLSPFLSLESGLLFLSHAFTSGTTGMSSSYIDIPVLLRVSPFSLIAVQAGPYYGIATSVTPGTNTNDFGLLGGASLRLPLLPNIKLRTDVMYQLGVVNLTPISGASQYSRNTIVLVGVMLDLL